MLTRSLLALALLGAASSAAAQAPRFPRGTDYADARVSLQALGWQPVTLPDADRCAAGDPRCQGRPEMHVCSGTGAGHCIFVWRRGDVLIEVITVGEDQARVSAVRCRTSC
jgi:hypothetical protein